MSVGVGIQVVGSVYNCVPTRKVASRVNGSPPSPDVARQVYDLALANDAISNGARACVFKMG